MFTPFSRIILLLLCASISVAAAVFNIYSLVVISSLASFILLYGYFRKGSVKLALARLRREDYTEAERIIDLNTHPERLDKRQYAYYLFVKGFVAREKDQFSEANRLLEASLHAGLRSENDIAMVLLALTDMEMVNKNRIKARQYFQQMKDLKVNPDMMPSIRKMQEWLG